MAVSNEVPQTIINYYGAGGRDTSDTHATSEHGKAYYQKASIDKAIIARGLVTPAGWFAQIKTAEGKYEHMPGGLYKTAAEALAAVEAAHALRQQAKDSLLTNIVSGTSDHTRVVEHGAHPSHSTLAGTLQLAAGSVPIFVELLSSQSEEVRPSAHVSAPVQTECFTEDNTGDDKSASAAAKPQTQKAKTCRTENRKADLTNTASYQDMILGAITRSKDRFGSSLHVIRQVICDVHPEMAGKSWFNRTTLLAVNKLVAAGYVNQVKGRYKISNAKQRGKNVQRDAKRKQFFAHKNVQRIDQSTQSNKATVATWFERLGAPLTLDDAEESEANEDVAMGATVEATETDAADATDLAMGASAMQVDADGNAEAAFENGVDEITVEEREQLICINCNRKDRPFKQKHQWEYHMGLGSKLRRENPTFQGMRSAHCLLLRW